MEFTGLHTNLVDMHDNRTIIGIYYRNGIFDEHIGNRGISYVLDHVLYEALCQRICDSKKGEVRCFTNHGYSEILILCEPENAMQNIRIAEDVLFASKLPYNTDIIAQWIGSKKNDLRGQRKTSEVLYYEQRAAGTPLAKQLSGLLTSVPSEQALRVWHTVYLQQANPWGYVSGAIPALFRNQNHIEETGRSALPMVTPSQTAFPRHIQWHRSQVVYSVPCEITADNILAAEAYCELLRPVFASEIRKHKGQLSSLKIQPDYFSELQLCFQCCRGTEAVLANRVVQSVFKSKLLISDTQINDLRNKLHLSYLQIARNAFMWNRFAGYNAITGKRYDIHMLLNEETYSMHISVETIGSIVSNMQNAECVNIFVSSVR